MKLRIKGSSVRIRLDQRDLEQLVSAGRVDDGMSFGSDPHYSFTYSVEIDEMLRTELALSYDSGHFLLRLARSAAEEWIRTDRVGFDATQAIGGSEIRILLEKDFACLDRPQGEEEDDAFAFPNPGAGCAVEPEERKDSASA